MLLSGLFYESAQGKVPIFGMFPVAAVAAITALHIGIVGGAVCMRHAANRAVTPIDIDALKALHPLRGVPGVEKDATVEGQLVDLTFPVDGRCYFT